jgi:catechol 2,3-dioxygenase-like lactoylglutathione lyase family enzyme
VFDHVSLSTADLATSQSFYRAALAPLGYRELDTGPQMAGFGDGERDLWIDGDGALVGRLHVAFRAPEQSVVADGCNTIALTRAEWRGVGESAAVRVEACVEQVMLSL